MLGGGATSSGREVDPSGWSISHKVSVQIEKLAAAANLIADLLLALHERPALRRSLQPDRERPWVDVAKRLVDDERERVHASERARLEQLYGDSSVEILQLPSEEPSQVRLASDHWVVLVELESFQELSARLAQLDEDDRLGFGFRTFTMASFEGKAIPLFAWQFGTRDSEPFLWPVDLEKGRTLASRLSREVLDSPWIDRAKGLLELCAEASRAASIARMRAPSLNPEADRERACELLRRAEMDAEPFMDDPEVAKAVTTLLRCVQAELAGHVDASIVAGIEQAFLTGHVTSAAAAAQSFLHTVALVALDPDAQ
jgi:hypothetical protein